MRSWLHRALCRVLGHDWSYYFYPEGDDWFSGPHPRRVCRNCNADEATDQHKPY